MTVQDWPCRSIDPAQGLGVDGDGPRYTNMNETRNETNRPPGPLWREAGPNHLTFRFPGGFAGSWSAHRRPFERVSLVRSLHSCTRAGSFPARSLSGSVTDHDRG